MIKPALIQRFTCDHCKRTEETEGGSVEHPRFPLNWKSVVAPSGSLSAPSFLFCGMDCATQHRPIVIEEEKRKAEENVNRWWVNIGNARVAQ